MITTETQFKAATAEAEQRARDLARWINTANKAIEAQRYDGMDGERGLGVDDSALGDVLANLMHWADCYGVDFDAALKTARDHYEAERR